MTTFGMTEQRMVERLTQRWVAEGETGDDAEHWAGPSVKLVWKSFNPYGRLSVAQACVLMELKADILGSQLLMLTADYARRRAQNCNDWGWDDRDEQMDYDMAFGALTEDRDLCVTMWEELQKLRLPRLGFWQRLLRCKWS